MFNNYLDNKVEYLPYDKNYPAVFDLIKNKLLVSLPNTKISHYGSTAINGLGGKGIIDIFIQTQRANINNIVIELETLGFHYPAFRTKPFPIERPMRAGSIIFNNKLYNIHAHITFVEYNRNVENALNFVKILERNKQLRDEYIMLKKSIISSGITEKEQYSEMKKSFIIDLIKTF